MANSQGDPRVLLAMNLVLSSAFSALVVWGLSFVGILEFGWQPVAVLAALLVIVTHIVVR